MNDNQKREILICADQARAHGLISLAQWYRCWAETGKQIGEKPTGEGKGPIYNGPVC